MRRAALLLGVALAAWATWLSQATGAPSASTVVDRTVRCTTSPSGGIWEVEARANAGTRLADHWVRLPFGAASTGNVTYALTDSLAWISAGRQSGDTMLDLDFRSSQVRDWGTVGVSRTVCKPAAAKVALSAAGLTGGAVGGLGEKLDCPSPRRVLLRVRAIASAKTALLPGGDFLRTSTPLKSGQLAVTTEKGRPIMYADVTESGKARLFTVRGCVFD